MYLFVVSPSPSLDLRNNNSLLFLHITQALNSAKDLQSENSVLTAKLESLTKDHFETRNGLERVNVELTQETKSLKDKLAIYENLEKEMDEVVMQCAEMEDETQADKVG